MPSDPALVELFKAKAEAVSAFVSFVSSPEESLEKAVALCVERPACELLPAGCALPLSEDAARLCEGKQEKIFAAPGLPAKSAKKLAALCKAGGLRLVKDGLRGYLSGVDVGYAVADAAIADTATLMYDSRDEELRLATMICEAHVALLPLSRLRAAAPDLAADLKARFAAGQDYTAFISGASRTADIERVLTLGVHGPLELHIHLWEDA
jgi:L-lactate dehydrogenase complex protein LldG